MRSIIFLVLFSFFLYGEDDSYQLGQGVQVGSLPLYIGGYTSLQYKNDANAQSYMLDDIALMLYGGESRFSYMAEVEYKDFYVKKQTDMEDTEYSDRKLYIERLYLDYTSSENFVIRLGKFNSPTGYWNMLPINVFRETTSSPKTKEILFPEFTTGVGLSYTSYQDTEIKFDLMLQNNPDLDDKYNSYEIDKHFAAGVTYSFNEFSWKINGGYFRQTEKKLQESERYYLLLSLKYELDKFILIGEGGSQHSNSRFTTPYALYLQSSYALTQKHSISVRLEAYKDNIVQSSSAHDEDDEEEDDDEEYEYRDISQKDEMVIFGYTYRPAYPIALKGEYQFHTLHSESKFLASLSVLF